MRIIEKLDLNRWREYKELKLESLTEAPLAFSPGIEEYESYTDEAWKEELEKSSNQPFELIFVEIDEMLVGMGGIFYYQMPQFKHNASLQALFVRKEYRGQGIGKTLIEKRIEQIKQKPGIKNVLCEVFSSQQASIELHKKCGFEVVGITKNFLHDTKNDRYYDNCLLQQIF